MDKRITWTWTGISIEALQELINQRKRERKEIAQAKRQHDLQRIKDMKSKEGIHPLERIPEELWKMILEELPPVAKGNMSQIHDLFENLTKETRNRDILFPQILELEERIKKNYHPPRLALRYPFLRKVCKSLRNEIDRNYETHLLTQLRMENRERYLYPTVPTAKVIYRMNRERYIYEHEEQDRFFKRSLSVYSIDSQDKFDRQKPYITRMLEEIGHQIWHFKFSVWNILDPKENHVFLSESIMYNQLNNWLDLMPNLKWLELELRIERTNAKCVVTKMLEEEQPRKLKKLERLELVFYKTHLVPLYEAFLVRNSHIKYLRLVGYHDAVRLASRWHVLHSLSLEGFSVNGDCYSYNNFVAFMKSIAVPKWQLKKINLFLDGAFSFDTNTNSVFRFLENFQTLERVTLFIHQIQVDGEGRFLNLPNLQHFQMVSRGDPDFIDGEESESVLFFFSLQFLLYSGKLKSIVWEDYLNESEKLTAFVQRNSGLKNSVDFCGGWKELRHDSNIWDIFPSLERVKAKVPFPKKKEPYRIICREYARRQLVRVEFEL